MSSYSLFSWIWVAIVIALLFFCSCSGKGIVVLEGYSHGVALCEGGGDAAMTTAGKAHMWKEDGVLFIINEGHLFDPQVDILEALAHFECAKYLKR